MKALKIDYGYFTNHGALFLTNAYLSYQLFSTCYKLLPRFCVRHMKIDTHVSLFIAREYPFSAKNLKSAKLWSKLYVSLIITFSYFFSMFNLKSVHFKKTVARISILSKLWYFLLWFVLKVPQFWKNRDSCNCLLKNKRTLAIIKRYFQKFPQKIRHPIWITELSIGFQIWRY